MKKNNQHLFTIVQKVNISMLIKIGLQISFVPVSFQKVTRVCIYLNRLADVTRKKIQYKLNKKEISHVTLMLLLTEAK